MSIDLHTHSHFSDGTMSPSELVALAKAKRLSAIALTDHDTMAGVEEAMAAGLALGIEIVPGIEISVSHQQIEYHILGYFADPEQPDFAAALLTMQEARNQRNSKILEKLKALGIAVTDEALQSISAQGQTGRPHIARLLVQSGVVTSISQAFDQFLKKGRPAFVTRFVHEAVAAVTLIRQAGGIAVLAHPSYNDPALIRLPTLLTELVPAGLEGIEAYYPTHSRAMRKKISALAHRYNLLLTGGSDYHGEVRPGTSLAGGGNVFVPPELLLKMKERWRQRRS